MKELIKISIIAEEGAIFPKYLTESASGADVHAYLDQPAVIPPGKSALIPTGLRFEIPQGYEIQIRPRSGLALNNSVSVLNTPGTIDADYRGEVKVILINHGVNDFVVVPKMRIAQLVVAQVEQASFIEVEALQTTGRGAGGFGHTGVK
ncbi:MAG: dUTP diphosphatase [Chlamydiales bacterium]